MPIRLLRYMLRFWEEWLDEHPRARSLPLLLPIVLHQGAKAWSGARSLAETLDLPRALRGHIGTSVPRLETRLLDLGRASPRTWARDFSGPPLAKIALVLMRAVADRAHDPLDAVGHVDKDLRSLLRKPQGEKWLRVLLRNTLFGRSDVDPERAALVFERAAGPRAGEIVMTTAQRLLKQGMKQGMKQGTRQVLELQLRERFGKLTRAIVDRLEAASAAELESWATRFVTARTVEDVFRTRSREIKRRRPDRKK